ncbi:MAG: efflux RND transporter permease subunit, partial [Candidatus Hydrogenedentes bacterium]|nr:efflux RND transporter permease subunit [Candidatus Hydrogenedentota bacterium]
MLEYLNFARDRLPQGVEPKLGPDATGVGWVYQYVLYPGYYSPDHPQGLWHDKEQNVWYAEREKAPADRQKLLERVRAFEEPGTCPLSGKALLPANQDLSQLRSLQDWYLRYPLTSVDGVSEVAPIGGYVRQYQVVLDPQKLQSYNIALGDISEAIKMSNNDVGGSVVELSENEYMVRSRGYLKGLDYLAKVPVGLGANGVPVMLGDVATLQVGGEARRGVGEFNGIGEAAGAVIVARFGENAYKVIQDVKQRL